MSRLLTVAVLACALVAVPGAAAAAEERYAIADDPEGEGYSTSLAIVMASPPDYERASVGRLGNDGEWVGPRFQATRNPNLGANAKIDWNAHVERAADVRSAILATLTFAGWPLVEEGQLQLEHRVGGRPVGTIAAPWRLSRSPTSGADDARYEAAVGWPLCGRFAVVRFVLLIPSGDSAGGAMGFGEYRVKGSVAPTVWNREQALASLRGVRLEGNLPVARVTARLRGGGVAGAVADCHGHPVSAAAVSLERRDGTGWTRVAGGTTSAEGAYTLAVRGGGVYRAVATFDGRRTTSAAVRVAATPPGGGESAPPRTFVDAFAPGGVAATPRSHSVRLPGSTQSVELVLRWQNARNSFDARGFTVVSGGQVVARGPAAYGRLKPRALKITRTRTATSLKIRVQRLKPRSVAGKAAILRFRVIAPRLATRAVCTTVVRQRAGA